MTTTDDLIERLAGDLAPVRPGAVARRLGLGIGAGALVSAAIMLAWLGVRPDIGAAVTTGAYWIKFIYTAAIAAAGLRAVERLARPAGRGSPALGAVALAVALAALGGATELGQASAAERMPLMMGSSASACPWIILVLSLPILVGAGWALRGLAPTRLALAGAAAGLAAGGLGAWIYAFHCTETATAFLAIWYTAGVVAVGLIGAALGPRLLRW